MSSSLYKYKVDTVPLCWVRGCQGCYLESIPQLSESLLYKRDTRPVCRSAWDRDIQNYDTCNVSVENNPPTRWKADVSPLPDDPVCVFGHVVVADDVVHAGQSLVHVLLQTLQILCLFVDRDDGVLQLHQATLERGQDGDLHRARTRSGQVRHEHAAVRQRWGFHNKNKDTRLSSVLLSVELTSLHLSIFSCTPCFNAFSPSKPH